MNYQHNPTKGIINEPSFTSILPPCIWPDARFFNKIEPFSVTPLFKNIFTEADLISGVIVGATDKTTSWLEVLFQGEEHKSVYLVLVLYPACPTRENHLKQIHELSKKLREGQALDVKLLITGHIFSDNAETVVLPPTVIQAYSKKTGNTLMSIGSVGDAGYALVEPGSLNFVFYPDDALRDAWRRWFQYTLSKSTPLTEETLHIPHLVPAEGTEEGQRLWQEFMANCLTGNAEAKGEPVVDPVTGEVTNDTEGEKIVPWDEGMTALGPLAQIFQQIYAAGYLVTMDEATRIKPLTIPVKATLLGQKSERSVGAIKQKQSFSLQVLDADVDKAIEKCRKVTDVVDLLTYPLSLGNRWLPDAAKDLLEKEIEARNEEGLKALQKALGFDNITIDDAETLWADLSKKIGQEVVDEQITKLGSKILPSKDAKNIVEAILASEESSTREILRDIKNNHCIEKFVERRAAVISKDLNEMYRQLGQGDAVPDDKRQTVLDEVKKRLKQALDVRITPRPVYNRIQAPGLTAVAPAENWNQPLSLLERSARILRESMTDAFFPRRFKGMAFTEADFRQAANIFGDVILDDQQISRAKEELKEIQNIYKAEKSSKEKCQDIWRLIKNQQ